MDPYALCPCGSGKKVKFCCHKLIPEMERIERLQENQPDQALVHLDKLEAVSPGNPWVVTTRAGTLMQQGEFATAKIALLKFLREHPEHPRANALYAFAAFHADGYPASKKAVHRAFKRCVEAAPRIVATLMEALADHHYRDSAYLAARAHLVLALRVAPVAEDRERIIQSLLRFDTDADVPFCLRGGHHIPEYEPSEANREAFDRARHLSLLACWNEAADALKPLTDTDGQSAALWHMLGLFRAWDADSPAAIEALRRAAGLYAAQPDSRETAVECETLAQFLERALPEHCVPVRLQRYGFSSVSQLLTRLDAAPQFVRSSNPEQPSAQAIGPVAVYLIYDRPQPTGDQLSALTLDSAPRAIGRVVIYDRDPEIDQPPHAYLSGVEGEQLEGAAAALNAAADDLLTREEIVPTADASAAPPPTEGLDVVGEIYDEELALNWNFVIPPGTPGHVQAAILDDLWTRTVEDFWKRQPQRALGGKSPLAAAGDDALGVPLEASLRVFEALAESRSQPLDAAALRQSLRLPASTPYPVTAETKLSHLSAFDLARLDPASLNDQQLNDLLQRLRIAPHQGLLYAALVAWCRREVGPPPEGESWAVEREDALATLATLATQAHRLDAALDWLGQGHELARASHDHQFERQLMWKMRELRTRIGLCPPEEIRPLLAELWERYSSKLPNLRSQLQAVAAALKIDPPWEHAIVTPGGWSPSAAAAGEPAKTLWLPGQD